MNIVADESVDRQIVDRLRDDGHLVQYVAELAPGLGDPAVVDLSRRSRAVLLTADKDFGELIVRQQHVLSGVILVRLAGLSAGGKAEIVSAAIRRSGAEMPGSFSVITPGSVRIRRMQRG